MQKNNKRVRRRRKALAVQFAGMDETKNTPETADGASKGGEGERECPTMYQPNKVGPYGNIVAAIEPRNLHEYPSDPDVFLRDLLDNIKKWRDDPAITAIWYVTSFHYAVN